MFFTKNKGVTKQTEYGRIYIFRFTLDTGKIVHKIGLCYSDRATDRMFEVLKAFFTIYRYVPKCELKRDKKVLIPSLVEKHLHKLLGNWSYNFDKKFGGSTEFFHNLDEGVLLEYLDSFTYNNLLEGISTIKETDYSKILDAIKKTTPTLEVNDTLPF